MRTRNSNFPNNSNVTIPRRQNKGRAPNIVEPELRTIITLMAERTMKELLRAPTEGYGEAIVLPEINADHFEIKFFLLQLVQANPFHGLENENPHAHINSFKRITSTLRFRNVTNDVIKLMMFSIALEGAAQTWESDSKKDERIDKLANQLSTLVEIVSKKVVTPAPVKAKQASTSDTLPSNTIPNPKGEMKAITTRSGVAYEGPSIPTNHSPKKVVERETEETTDKEQTKFQGSTAHIPPPVIPISIPEPDVPKTLPKTTPIPEPDVPKNLPKPNYFFFPIFPTNVSKVPFSLRFKSLLMNKEKLLELAKISLNENCSAMLLKKLPEKLGDPDKFLIPCDFSRMDDNDDSILKEDVQEENFQVYSNPLFEFDGHYNSSDINLLFKEEGSDNDEFDAFLAIEVPMSIEEVIWTQRETYFILESDPLHHEFAGEVIKIPPRIVREHEDYISRMSLLCRNSSSRSPENSHTIIESLPTSTTLVEDSDSNREEIDICSGPDDSIPPGIESDFYSEEDIIDNLLNDDPIPEYERLTFDMEPDVPVINNVDELNEDECFDPGGGEINVEVDDSFTFVIRTFLPYLTYPEFSPLLSSTENEDTIFDPGIFAFHFSSQEPVVVKRFMEFCSSTCFIPKDE
ncbi:hypothetical protein Tco_1420267 [Tanacetum coccineum]